MVPKNDIETKRDFSAENNLQDILNKIVWGDEELDINCPNSHYIHIIYAFYGDSGGSSEV